MTKPALDNDDWQPCPPGVLGGMVQKARRRRRHEVLNRGLAAALVLVLTVWGGVFVASRHQGQAEFDFGGITCSRVRALMPEYMAGKLAATKSESIRQHLAQCPHCGQLMERMRQQMPAAASMESGTPVVGEHRPGDVDSVSVPLWRDSFTVAVAD
ncbi:MAG TPA: zf-HC2 domain-containing protein [Pirellulales bacterium]|nr:zf-HC2 domain-containing protein [Pirellulales bacterium]